MSDIEKSARIIDAAIKRYDPTHIVSMVSGGTDSAASHTLLKELGVKVDFVLHGITGTGLKGTQKYVEETYGRTDDLIFADAGSAYENYVMRKGFFGVGQGAHQYAYRILKAQPFRKAISKHIRKGSRGVRVLMLNGARRLESENRKKNLKMFRRDPAAINNIWVNPIHYWGADKKGDYLRSRGVEINPVAKALCRSGECMCGTMQSKAARIEASAYDPDWGDWLDDLEATAIKKHGWGWGMQMPSYIKAMKRGQYDMFMPMCVSCGDEEQKDEI